MYGASYKGKLRLLEPSPHGMHSISSWHACNQFLFLSLRQLAVCPEETLPIKSAPKVCPQDSLPITQSAHKKVCPQESLPTRKSAHEKVCPQESLPMRKSAHKTVCRKKVCKGKAHDLVCFLQMLVLRTDWQAALPTLTQLGNGLALVTCLDSMLGSQADCAFMQLAPLLGITLGIGNHMQRSVSHSQAFRE